MKTMFIIVAGATALAVIGAPSYSSARDEDSIRRGEESSAKHGVQGTQDAGMAKTPTSAAEFVTRAAEDGMAEVALGKMAVAQGANPDVKQFGQRMVDDHSKANDELKSLASSKGIQAPTEPNAKQKATADRLSRLSGAAFDEAYMQAMVGDHDHAVTMFKEFSERGDDSDLKQWAEKTLPTLQDHERLAKTTATKVAAREGMSSSRGAESGTIHTTDKGNAAGPVRTTQKGRQ